MRILRLWLEYDGTHFSGWQTQPGRRTVQAVLEEVLSSITQEKIAVDGASRTDAGVHALGQVATFRTRSRLTPFQLLGALNGLLPEDVTVCKVKGLKTIPQPRKKLYRYLIWNHKTRSPLLRRRAWHVWQPLDVKVMKSAARHLIGRHDFTAFRGARSQTKTSVRRIEKLRILPGKPWAVELTGDGFLKYMVRNIVGTLVEVGVGKRSAAEVADILKSKDRRKAGRTAPAHGLYLVKIWY